MGGFGRVQSIDFTETIALEAARIQDQLASVVPTYDLRIAASARSTGETLVVTDDDFAIDPLRQVLSVRRL